MVDAKSLLAGVVLALVGAAAAAADNPTVRISHADQLKAEAALLALKDFGLIVFRVSRPRETRNVRTQKPA